MGNLLQTHQLQVKHNFTGACELDGVPGKLFADGLHDEVRDSVALASCGSFRDAACDLPAENKVLDGVA